MASFSLKLNEAMDIGSISCTSIYLVYIPIQIVRHTQSLSHYHRMYVCRVV